MKINWGHLVAIIIGWTLTLYVFLYFITSCSVEHHLAKSQKHIDIAKRKGAVIVPDTVWQYNYTKETVFDTITNTYKEVLRKDSTATTINNNITPGMSRQERKALDDYYKHLEKMMKLGNDSLQKQLNNLVKLNKQNQKTERTIIRQENKPWMWIAISLICIAVIVVLITFKKFFRI
jgi:cell division protein FtsN